MKKKRLPFILLYLIAAVILSIPASEVIAQHQHAAPKTEKKDRPEKKVKYWTCGMHPQVREDKPGNCPICNMKLVPVYEQQMSGEETGSGATDVIKLSKRDIELAGVLSEPVMPRHLFKEIRTVGKIAYDPELYKAEEEYIQALKAGKELEKSDIETTKENIESLTEAARLKLKIKGLSDEQIDELSGQAHPDRSLIISDEKSPYVWVYADVYEYELSWIKAGQPLKVVSISYPGEEFKGKIDSILPILNPMTRAVRIIVKIENPELKLKPEMYVDISTESYITDKNGEHQLVLAVPQEAVLDTGARKIVYLDLGDGSYSAREVQLGPEAESYTDEEKRSFFPVAEGLKEGDVVVTKANFLIDSQSQLTGVSAAYGGALGAKEEKASPLHQH